MDELMDEAHLNKWMKLALEQAEEALVNQEVAVGCVIVHEPSSELSESKLISYGRNETNETHNATRHAEFVAIDRMWAEGKYSIEFLQECTLYVTCEPCIMCASALALVKIKKVVFGCHNDKFGGCGSILSLHEESRRDNVHVRGYVIVSGILKTQAIELLRQFYAQSNTNAPEHKRKIK